MGSLRITNAITPKERATMDRDHAHRVDQAVGTTNDDLDWSDSRPETYDLERAQNDALIVHTRQDVAMGYFQNEAILAELKSMKRGVEVAKTGVWIITILQIVQLAGCHW